MLILGLLRFKVLSQDHFRTIFGEDEENLQDDGSFTDKKKKVPFVGDSAWNDQLASLTPAFARLQELHGKIEVAKQRLNKAE